jgi:hypothetical protein
MIQPQKAAYDDFVSGTEAECRENSVWKIGVNEKPWDFSRFFQSEFFPQPKCSNVWTITSDFSN